MLSPVISKDIVNYFLTQKSYSQRELALSMDTTVERIRSILYKKEGLSKEELDMLLKLSNMKFWEFASLAISPDHLPIQIRKRIAVCKEISDHLKKKKKE